MKPGPRPERGDATREALLGAAVTVFARDGFDAARTRTIAAAAGVNQALIGYHFGNKAGLYRAVFEHLAAAIETHLQPARATLAAELGQGTPGRPGRARCLALLGEVTDAFVGLMTSAESAPWARLIIREQQAPTAAFDVLYARVMAPFAQDLEALVTRLAPARDTLEVRLAVLSLIGQVLVFRTARAAVERFTGWRALGEDEVAVVRAHLRDNLRRLFAPAGRRA
ncbi:MAG: CerR family C-terminal domain-containing protein [Gammaproteobacteria bacterium]|nr:CerR family C-terminal domain-containing protein [Gammaproteobacteria bacterium]MCP5199917.1 CerR family C-terminal domain-containing protein [Gammaproteobacteria bacterium]